MLPFCAFITEREVNYESMLLTALACGKAEENDPVQSTTASGAVSDATTEVTTAETQDPNTVPEIPDTQYTGFYLSRG